MFRVNQNIKHLEAQRTKEIVSTVCVNSEIVDEENKLALPFNSIEDIHFNFNDPEKRQQVVAITKKLPSDKFEMAFFNTFFTRAVLDNMHFSGSGYELFFIALMIILDRHLIALGIKQTVLPEGVYTLYASEIQRRNMEKDKAHKSFVKKFSNCRVRAKKQALQNLVDLAQNARATEGKRELARLILLDDRCKIFHFSRTTEAPWDQNENSKKSFVNLHKRVVEEKAVELCGSLEDALKQAFAPPN